MRLGISCKLRLCKVVHTHCAIDIINLRKKRAFCAVRVSRVERESLACHTCVIVRDSS